MRWQWLFDLELWLWRREQPDLNSPAIRPRWSRPRRLVARLTRRLERRGRML